MYVCMYVCVSVCLFVCMFLCIFSKLIPVYFCLLYFRKFNFTYFSHTVIIIIIRCSRMFWNVPHCGFYQQPIKGNAIKQICINKQDVWSVPFGLFYNKGLRAFITCKNEFGKSQKHVHVQRNPGNHSCTAPEKTCKPDQNMPLAIRISLYRGFSKHEMCLSFNKDDLK